MMKKIIIGIMASSLLVSLFCGCSKKVDVTEEQTTSTETEAEVNDTEEDTEIASDDDVSGASIGISNTFDSDIDRNYNDEWKDAYIDFLETNKADLMDSAFISYVCDDEIPFLFVAREGEWRNGMFIYTYYNGELKQVGDSDYGHYGAVNAYEGLGLIGNFGINQGYNSEYFYNVTPSGDITEGDYFVIENYDSDEPVYRYNDEVIDYQTWMQKKMNMTRGKAGNTNMVLPIDKLIAYLKGELQETTEYGDTIKTVCDTRSVGVMSNTYGVEYFSQGVEYDTFVISTGSQQFIDDEFEKPSDEEVKENVNQAVGKKIGDTFTIKFRGGDGIYYHVYTILDIE